MSDTRRLRGRYNRVVLVGERRLLEAAELTPAERALCDKEIPVCGFELGAEVLSAGQLVPG